MNAITKRHREEVYERFVEDLKSQDQRVRMAALAIQARVQKVSFDAEVLKNTVAALAMLDENGPLRSLDQVEKAFEYWDVSTMYTTFAPDFANYLMSQMVKVATPLNKYGN
ncbi:MAG: hypothetical protein JRN21_09795 [Nitrososphaerota archaeon]|nr:hypothetical protein [Nitrososphaerota archaeon]